MVDYLCVQITRLPDPEMVESLQLLRYVPGKWYKPHQDLFHHPKQPFEEKSRGPPPA